MLYKWNSRTCDFKDLCWCICHYLSQLFQVWDFSGLSCGGISQTCLGDLDDLGKETIN